MVRWLSIGCAIFLLAGQARAHGAFPTSLDIAFGPGRGDILLGTNFGAVLLGQGGGQHLICETAVTGLPQALGGWAWLESGVVLGVVTDGGLSRGVFASDPSACVYATVGATEDLAMGDLVQDPIDGDAFYATGTDGTRTVLLHGRPGESASVLYEDTTAPSPPPATSVRAGGGHAYAVIAREGGAATLVHHDGARATTVTHAAPEGGGTLRVLGVSPSEPETLWLTLRGETADRILRSEDAGRTLTPVTEIAGRVGGFAMKGEVVWLQSPELGMHRSEDGGRTFAPLPSGPLGSCLELSRDGRLYACGVPWRDGFALGVSDDGTTFTPVMTFFDGIEGPIACPAAPETTATCGEELAFLRDYYGFGIPTTNDGDGGDGADADAGEQLAEGADDDVAVETVTGAEVNEPSGSGCAGGTGASGLALVVLGAGAAFYYRADGGEVP